MNMTAIFCHELMKENPETLCEWTGQLQYIKRDHNGAERGLSGVIKASSTLFCEHTRILMNLVIGRWCLESDIHWHVSRYFRFVAAGLLSHFSFTYWLKQKWNAGTCNMSHRRVNCSRNVWKEQTTSDRLKFKCKRKIGLEKMQCNKVEWTELARHISR